MVLYSTGCPKCKVLEAKLTQKNIQFEINSSIEEMESLGFSEAPMLKIDDGTILSFPEAVQYINKL